MGVTTKRGDYKEGPPTTDTFQGGKRLKSDPALDPGGTIDEASAEIDIALNHMPDHILGLTFRGVLENIQERLVYAGGEISAEDKEKYRKDFPAINSVDLKEVEGASLSIEKSTKLRHWVRFNKDCLCSAHLNKARTIVRRAERELSHHLDEGISKNTFNYLNRLSDLLFNMAVMLKKLD